VTESEMTDFLGRASFYLAFGSAASILFSIAVSQILLALSLVALLMSGKSLRFPPLGPPLTFFFVVTVLAVLASADPRSGLPQVRKFFVFGILLAIYATFETVPQVLALIISWVGMGVLSGLLGVAQFLHRRQEANTYEFLVDGRITGFMSHWMTFGGEEMVILLMLAALVLFSGRRSFRIAGWPVLGGLLAAVALGMTRSIFLLGVPTGLSYLLWRRRRMAVFGAVAAILAAATLAPTVVRERAISAFHPRSDLESTSHRAVCRSVGWEMIRAHPWLGLGPEQIARQFERYVPATIQRPLPRGWYGHLHNIYLQYAAERGLFGLLGILWLIGKAASDFLKYLRMGARDRDVTAILHGAIAVTMAILAEGFFEYNLGDSEVLTMFLSVLACGYVAARTTNEPSATLHLAARRPRAAVLLPFSG
jgi:putative inorganic carbon (HCO3(-)) transporter